MLISPVAEEENGKREGRGDGVPAAGHTLEYQTASELFDLMASNHMYRAENGENETLTTQDLVLIYKNIDLGTKLMSDANEANRKPPNQYVETIVYDDLDSDSDLSEICSYEDIHNVMLINNERINLLAKTSSFENTVCHKFGDIELCTSDLSVEYDRKFRYTKKSCTKNPIKLGTKSFGTPTLPVSLLDYICCKRLEENYNFDMDNIIKYVKHTIDQLKRISNGDYLTEKVKEKWRGIDNTAQIKHSEVGEAKVLSNTTSIPMYVERKVTGNSTKWDDLVHSSVDIRSLSKILEKKIIVEVPKTLCGSYTLFSKCCDDNLIIRCQKSASSHNSLKPKKTSSGSHVDVVVHLNRSQSGNVISNINTIMILQKPAPTDLLPLLTIESSLKVTTSEEKVIETKKSHDDGLRLNSDNNNQNLANMNGSCTDSPSNYQCSSENLSPFETGDSGYNSSLPNAMYNNYGDRFKKFGSGSGSPINFLPSDEFRLTIQKLNMSSLPEESTDENSIIYSKKRSPTRNRIKSPYENKSHLAEEKKRKKLLEVRQKREKSKMALAVNGCRVKKMKYPIPPQTANSVTKLSISNKSFYNSIYGHAPNVEPKPSKTKVRKEATDAIPEVPSDADLNSSTLSPDIREIQNQKYINKSYYLDNAVTEMMYMDKQKSEADDSLAEITANDIKMELKLLSHLITPSVITLAAPELGNESESPRHKDYNIEENESKRETNAPSSPLEHPEPPNNSPLSTDANMSEKEINERDAKKASNSSEFIKSIDKIYELIHKLGKAECNETKLFKSKFTAVAGRATYNDPAGETSTVQCSDSGTSVKHQLTSSNPSCFSFEKSCKVEQTPTVESPNKKTASNVTAANVVPKVIISAKTQNAKVNGEKPKRDRRLLSGNRQNNPQNTSQNTAASDNPLKAISQLLHDFDNVQKNRNKTVTERVPRKPEVSFADVKAEGRHIVRKASRVDNRFEQHFEKQNRNVSRDKKSKSPVHQHPNLAEHRPGNKGLKKNVVDIVDEIKEARGEAVRGPCKLNARLNSLAQPKKTYVQAQIEEFHARFGKSIITDRLQKMSGTRNVQNVEIPKYASSKQRRKKDCPETLSTSKSFSNAHPAVLEKARKRSPNNNKLDNRMPNDQYSKEINAFTRETTKKKMTLSFECPGRLPSLPNSENSNIDDTKMRAPYIPNDIEIGSMISSMEESSAIRSNIRQMMNVMIANTMVKNKDNSSNLSEENEYEKVFDKNLKEKLSEDEINSSDDYQQDRRSKIKCEYMIGDTIPETKDPPPENPANLMPGSECAKALQCNRNLAIGTFQKCINHKRLALTPKESMQKVLLLQSGDSNSVILQSTMSQNIFKKKIEPEYHPMLTNLDWNFAQFPVQMPIIGYSIPKYLKPRPGQTDNQNSDQNTSSKTTQCFKGTHVDQFSNHPSHIDVKDFLTMSSLLKMGTTVIEEEPEDVNVVSNKTPEKSVELIKKASAEVIKKASAEDIKKASDKVITKTSSTGTSNLGNADEQIDIPKDEIAVITDGTYVDTSAEKNINTLSETCVNSISINKVPSDTSSMDTTSLDVLVGLLNEIQKITSCQSQMANSDTEDTDVPCADMQAILNSAAALESVEQGARNIISITSLDKLRKLESNTSILSFYLSNHGDNDAVGKNIANINITPLHVDKGVSTVMPMAFVNKCTSVPSQLFPLTKNHSTNVSNSLIGVISEPSSHSILTYNEQPVRSNRSLTCLTNIFELQNNITRNEGNQLPIALTRKHDDIDGYRKVPNKKGKVTNHDKYKLTKKNLNQKFSVDSDFDPVMKMKRDILVTVYSVLVLTVFAALSFPDILYSA